MDVKSSALRARGAVLDRPLDTPTLADMAACVERLAATVEALSAEVRGWRADLHRPRRRPQRRGLLAAVALAVKDRAFTAAELFDHAEVDAALDAALTRADVSTVRALGKYLASIEGRTIDGVRVVRLDHERGVAVWRCECVP